MASKTNLIKKIESLLPGVLAVDRLAARREIQRLCGRKGRAMPDQKSMKRLGTLEKRLQASVKKRDRRKAHLPQLRFNEELPIFAKKDEIIEAIARHPVIVVSGETGSGKTTQLPKYCLAAGRGVDGLIGCTQPRRIAATTVSRRIAEELGQEPGQAVGYKIRFKDRTDKDTYIKLMTDGILLAETQGDRYLSAYDTIIVDEAHERSLNIDFILGILQTLVSKRDDLKLIITSATIDTEKFSKAFRNAPIIEVSGRMYPVEVQYIATATDPSQNGELTHVELAVQVVKRVLNQSRAGDILVFMPTEQDIRETCELLEAQTPPETRVMPLFARLTAAEQSRVFARLSRRKIIVATNVAETSITIPGIKYVVDSGLARISRYSPTTRTTSLPVVPVSRSSCDQRKGRCGRVQSGVCLRLYSEDDYQARPQFTPPEILRANLAEVILRMISLKLGDVSDFPFIDRPDAKNIKDGFNLLSELGAIAKRQSLEFGIGNAERKKEEKGRQTDDGNRGAEFSDHKSQKQIRLTEKGRLMAKIPLDPRLSRMVIEAKQERCIAETAIIAAALSIQDPRERPLEKVQEADRMHAGFDDPNSDFVTLLNIWRRYHDHWQAVKSSNQMKKFCRQHYLSFKRMREWRDIHSQILAILKEYRIWNAELGMRNAEVKRRKAEGGRRNAEGGRRNAASGPASSPAGFQAGGEGPTPRREVERRKTELTESGNFKMSEAQFGKLHRSVLSGFLSNIAMQKEKNIFRAGKGKEVMIFPGSGLFNKAQNWIVAAEMVETSRVFARSVANIDSGWLEELGGDLCRRTYLEPHWEKNRGEVVASEQVSLFGLIIVPDRKVSFGKVNPAEASKIFIQSALVNGDVKKPFAFMKHNQQLIDEIIDIENRFRRRDLLIDEQRLFEFYQEQIPEIYDIRTLARFLKQKANDHFLRMKKDAILAYYPDDVQLTQYPDRLDFENHSLECSYCFEPGKDEDGVTVKVPATLAPAVSPESIDWLVPGLYPQKIEALIKGLPKSYRRKLVPVKNTVDVIVREMPKTRTSLISALGDFIYRRFGLDIPASVWSQEALPDYLKMRVSITAPDGQELRAGRDAGILRQDTGSLEKSDELKAARMKWEKSGITRWDFGDLPEFVSDSGEKTGRWIAYPALENSGPDKPVNLRLVRHQDKALAAHCRGVAALYAIHFAKDIKFLKRQLILPADKAFLADYFGGAKRLVKQMVDRVIQELFGKNIRSQKAFYSQVESVAPKILSTGRELIDCLVPVLTAYHDARSQIHKLQQSSRQNSRMMSFFQELTAELARLVPETFITIYDKQRLAHLVRYIQAATIRARRAAVDFEKDQSKFKGIIKFSEGLNQLLNELSPKVSDEKRQAIEEYFWMIEEYKVSVFAQELKTAIPISAKRLEQKLQQIQRMA
jgi:ATP-dependent helicase HrpA